MPDKVTIAALQQMKRDGKKIAGVVAWDTPMAKIADRAGADFPDAVRVLVEGGIWVFAQFGLTPQTAAKHGIPYSAQNSPDGQATAEAAAKLVEEARMLEQAGACMLDFTNSGPVAGAAVVKAVKIP